MEFSLGIGLDPNRPLSAAIDDQAELLAYAARFGVRHALVGHHWISHPNVFLEPWPTIGYLSALLPEMSVSAFVAAPLYQPVDLAEKIATLDQLTKGRFVFRCGVGWRPEEFAAIGADVRQRARRFEEILTICKQLWSGEAISFQGRYYNLQDARMAYTPFQKPHPPIWIGAQSEAAVRRAARIGDAPWIPFQVGYADVKALMEAYRDELQRHGKPYPREIPLMRFISADRDRARALERLQPLAHYFDWYSQSPHFSRVKLRYTFDEESRERTSAGTPEEVVESLWRYAREFGVTLLDLYPLWPATEKSAMKEHIAFLAETVLAPLRARSRLMPVKS
jgi:alkanesulfonate monooxygenase SsuD/methylene tetrahydromethanopterin reductase-like flavin-dependent oxidoreductase (luciferase family)